jgi:hypothetical protein
MTIRLAQVDGRLVEVFFFVILAGDLLFTARQRPQVTMRHEIAG